jgi:hypothetical protein
MKQLVRLALCAAFLTLFAATAGAMPVISGLSATTLARSGRLHIAGSGFGATQGTSSVQIGGVTALVTVWSDTVITAYVPEAAPIGAVTVQVNTGAGASDPAALSVTLRQANGRIRWRFQADSPYFFQRPAVGPDGTIIAHDAGGFVYALAPDGALKWIYHTRTFASGPPSVGADGSVYVGNSTTVTALNSDGTLKWSFDDPNGDRSLAAGPTVGPDGKIYAFFDVFNVYAITPAGAVAWHNTQSNLFDLFEYGAEMAFGPSQAGQPADRVYFSFGVSPAGFLWSFNMANGGVEFAHPQAGTWDSSMQPQGQAVTATDGTIYTACNVAIGSSTSVNAFNPDGTVKWSVERFGGISAPDLGTNGNSYFVYQAGHLGALSSAGGTLWNVFDGTNNLQYPIANPAGGMVFVGGGVYGSPGFVRAHSVTNGTVLWQLDLGAENGGNQWIGSRPRFATDGQTVYFGTTIPTAAADSYCYLYAVDTSITGTIAPPLLRAVRSGHNLVFTWPAAPAGFGLESSPIGGALTWTAAGPAPVPVGTNLTTTVPMDGAGALFRLHRP